MKKIFILLVAAGMLGLTGCTDEQNVIPENENKSEEQDILLHVNLDTKASTRLAYDDAEMKTVWEEGDVLEARSEMEVIPFTLIEGAGTSKGTFKGEAVNVNKMYKLYYKKEDSPAIPTQSATNPTAHINKMLSMESDDIYMGDCLEHTEVNMCVVNKLFRIDLNMSKRYLRGLKKVTMETHVGRNDQESLTVLVEDSPELPKSIYLATDENHEVTGSGMDMRITFYAATGVYEVKANTSTPKTYEKGTRYVLTVGDEVNPGRFKTWFNQSPMRLIEVNYNDDSTAPEIEGLLKIKAGDRKWFYTSDTAIETLKGNWFRDNTSIDNITLPLLINKIEPGALKGCSNLSSFTFAEKGEYFEVPDSMFMDCRSLSKIEVPSYIGKVGKHAFAKCDNLKELKLPKSVKEVGDSILNGANVKELNMIVEFNAKTNINAYLLLGEVKTENINLWLEESWFDSDLIERKRASLATNSWLAKSWKSIYMIDENGNLVNPQLPDIENGGDGL